MKLQRSEFRVTGNARNGFRVSQGIGSGWDTLSDRFATAAAARAEIARILDSQERE